MNRLFVLATAFILLAVLSSALCAQETGWGMHKRMFAVPAPAKVVIDGNLDDWDLSGAIEMYVMAATKDVQGAKFAVMYDADAVYLGAEVRDPTPLMNRHSPEAEGDTAWDADSCQVRMVIDPAAGYPVIGNVWGTEQRASDQLVHMLLWHYTDRQEANLQLASSMAYHMLPGAQRFGVMPKDTFQGVYRLMADKRGYTFEYRIPWKTLNATTPPKGGDIVAATMQITWSRPDGLKTNGTGGWGYDLLAYPGVAYQTAECWGKIIFAKTGHLPKELVEDGQPPDKPLPLTFAYDLPRDSQVTLALFNEQNEVVRALATQAQRPAGHLTERWDGLDELERPLPPGKYTWKGLYHQPITTKYVLSVHNSGQPAWRTDDNTGGWGGDHGVPMSVCNAGNGMALCWGSAEVGWGLIRTDGEGKKQWGILRPANYLTSDGECIFASGGYGSTPAQVNCFACKDGQPRPYGNGAATLLPPPGGSEETNAVTGLTCQGGKIYVAFQGRNLIGVYDAKQGELLQSLPAPEPGMLAIGPDGALLVVSAGKVLALQDGTATTLVANHLDAPTGIAVDANGLIYVANQGMLQNVSVFSPHGVYLRSIGKAGGRPLVGRYDPSGMLSPTGIAVDAKGRLWVAEAIDSPKRVSVWNTRNGKLVKEFFGGAHYSSFIWIDPDRPDEVVCDGTIWKVNLTKGTSYPYSTYWRTKGLDSPGVLDTHNFGLKVFTAKNGHQYGWGMDNNYSIVLFMRAGDIFKPILSFFYPSYYPDGKKKYPDGGTAVWVDKNDDQLMQADEMGPVLSLQDYRGFAWADENLNLWHAQGDVYRPLRFEKDGRPVYDFAKREHFVTSPTRIWGRLSVDGQDSSLYMLKGGEIPGKDIGFGRWTPDGQMLWGYRGAIEWTLGGFGLPPQRAGKLWGPIALLGTAGDYTGFATYFGCHHLFTRDGLCVAMIFRDPRLGGAMDSDVIFCENGNGQLVKPRGMNRYFALGGDQDGRISEVLGLDTVKRLPGGTLTVTEEDYRKVLAAQAEYQAKKTKIQKLTIVRGRTALNYAESVSKTVSAEYAFQAKAAYDAQNLYLAYTVTSPAELVNGTTDPKLLFKGGNCLDIQLATDQTADANRTLPAPGDVRILVTRQQEKPYAVIYRPKMKDFAGEPAWTLTSPTGKEQFDAIEATDKISIDYRKLPGISAFTATVTIPLTLLGWTPQPGSNVKMDVGYIFGNTTGTQAMARAYWTNNGFAANILKDVPTESRLEPREWGLALVE